MALEILLINSFMPFLDPKVLDAPLSLTYLGAVAKNEGHLVRCLDLQLEKDPFKAVRKEAKKGFDIAGITCVSSTFFSVPEICKILKNENPKSDSWIILGGSHPTFCAKEILHQIPEVDIIVIGEGEYTFQELLNIKQYKSEIKNIKGIAYRQFNNIIFTQPRSLIENLDNLPLPERDLFQSKKYNQRHILTARGCPFNCIFCTSPPMWHRKVRVRSIKSVIEEIQRLVINGDEKFYIIDDIFTLYEQRVIDFCKNIIKRNFNIEWSCLSHINYMSKKLACIMKQANCKEISFGCESGSIKVLKIIRKKIDPINMIRVIKETKDIGISVRTSWILGLPGDDRITIQETINVMIDASPDTIVIYSPIPYPGTYIANHLAELKMVKYTEDVSKYFTGVSYPIILPKSLSQEEYLYLIEEVIERLKEEGYEHINYDEEEPIISGRKIISTQFVPSIGLHANLHTKGKLK